MNRKWFFTILSIIATALAVSAIMASTFHSTGRDIKNGAEAIGGFMEDREGEPCAADIPCGVTLAERQDAFEKWGGIDMDADGRARYPEGFVPLTPQEQSLLNSQDNITEDLLLGEEGEDGPPITGSIETERRANESYAMLLCRMAFKYNRGIAYMEGGEDWGGGISPSDGCPKGMAGLTGIGNPEYVQMLYMYTFGYVPGWLMEPEKLAAHCSRITPGELRTGDIAVSELEDGRKDYAVCIGAYRENFLFAHCANTADSAFPNGCAKICFMSSQTDGYYRGSEPADFTRFYRSPARFWGNPDNDDGNTDMRILVEISENAYGSDAVCRYADRVAHELASGSYGSFMSDLARAEITKYGYEYTDENAYRRYLDRVYKTMRGKDRLYVAFVNDRDGHYNAAVYGLDYSATGRDISYDYGSLDIMYLTIFHDKENGFTMLPFNAGTIEYNYSLYGLSRIQ